MQTNIHTTLRRTITIATFVAMFLGWTQTAFAVSSWNPALLVNTESFQTIDDGDSTTNIELRFGATLNERIFWNRTNGRFEFTDDVYVQGDLTASGVTAVDIHASRGLTSSGNITWEGTASGADLWTSTFAGAGLSDCDASNQKITWDATTKRFVCGTDNDTATVYGAGQGLSLADNIFRLNETLTGTSLEIYGTASGRIVHAQDKLESSGSLAVDGATNLKGNTTLGDASMDQVSVNSATWSFANDTNFALTGGQNGLSFDTDTFSIDAENNRIGVGTTSPAHTLDVVGDIHASTGLSTSGNLVWEGSASGADLWTSTFAGAGLSDCDASNQKITWDATTKRFVCGTDNDTVTNYYAGQGLSLSDSVFRLNETLTGTSLEIYGTASGRVIHAQDRLESSGALVVADDIMTRSNIKLNNDNGDVDAILTFGNDGGAETIRFNNTTNNFTFSDDVDVTGNIKATGNVSGSTLTIDGAVTLRGQTMMFPTNAGSNGSVLTTDGAGNLTWGSGNQSSSGGILSLHPEYPNAIYYQSGSTYIGQLTASGAMNSGFENTYQWTSSNGSIQDYWISTRIRVPNNFSNWDPNASLQLRYRTKTGMSSDNHITVRLLDTTGANVPLTGGAALANTSFTTASITGPVSAGTYTPGGYITILIKMAATSSGQANVGYLNLNWETTTQ